MPGRWDGVMKSLGLTSNFFLQFSLLSPSKFSFYRGICNNQIFLSLYFCSPFLPEAVQGRRNSHSPITSYCFKDNHTLPLGQTFRQNWRNVFGASLWITETFVMKLWKRKICSSFRWVEHRKSEVCLYLSETGSASQILNPFKAKKGKEGCHSYGTRVPTSVCCWICKSHFTLALIRNKSENLMAMILLQKFGGWG